MHCECSKSIHSLQLQSLYKIQFMSNPFQMQHLQHHEMVASNLLIEPYFAYQYYQVYPKYLLHLIIIGILAVSSYGTGSQRVPFIKPKRFLPIETVTCPALPNECISLMITHGNLLDNVALLAGVHDGVDVHELVNNKPSDARLSTLGVTATDAGYAPIESCRC